jgi:transcriptional activator SPT7
MTDTDMGGALSANNGGVSAEGAAEDDERVLQFREQYVLSERRLAALFSDRGALSDDTKPDSRQKHVDGAQDATAPPSAPPKKVARTIDEDDYGDDDDEDEDEPEQTSPLQQKSALAAAARALASPATPLSSFTPKTPLNRLSSVDQAKSSDDARKQAEEDKQALEDAAKRSFHTLFYTLENDRVAMLEQQKLDELDRQVEAETSGQEPNGSAPAGAAAAPQQGSLSTANLGASSLMLKHLLARVDGQRSKVHANDSQLRRLISEVRKNRSKWASEDKVNQEELYEAAEKVLQELKAMTENSVPFLNKVSKREAPDYYNFIKNPMDIGTMMKKLKTFQYKSKKEFVDDLHLIWTNCLKYNTDPQHPLRKKALVMQKHTDRLVILIPDLVVRDRAEVEAEERRNASLDADLDGIEDSDDGTVSPVECVVDIY